MTYAICTTPPQILQKLNDKRSSTEEGKRPSFDTKPLLLFLDGFCGFGLLGSPNLGRVIVSSEEWAVCKSPTFFARFFLSCRSLREGFSTLAMRPFYEGRMRNANETLPEGGQTLIKRYLGSNFFCEDSSS